MKCSSRGVASVLLVGILLILISGSGAYAQVTGLLYANGLDYFSSDSDTYNYQSPLAPPNPGTGLTTVNAFNALNGIPGAPAGGLSNAYTNANSFSFSSPYGYTQADPLPAAQKTVAGLSVVATYNPPLIPYVTAPRIQAFPYSSSFNGLHQAANAPGYALTQFDFEAFYSVGPSGVLPAVKTVTATISGNLVASGANLNPFAEFGYEINYYEVGLTTTSLGSAGVYGSWLGAGPVYASLLGSPSSISGFPYSTYQNPITGVIEPVELEVTGTMFMAGDPSSLDADVEDDIPEPASLGLMATTGLLILRRRRA